MAAIDPIDLRSDALRIRILPMGASLVAVYLGNIPRNLVLGFDDPADHLAVPVFAGPLVGPVANRVRAGRVTIDGRSFQMPCNEKQLNTLHSGPDGLHAQLWRVMAYGHDEVTLACALPDGACGLPGNRHFMARYSLSGPCMTLTIEARTDAPTPINIAAHPYWNLDGRPDVSGHNLEVMAQMYLPTDAQSLPTGEAVPVTGTAFDFRRSAPVPTTHPLDVNFCLSDHTRDLPLPAARLTGADGTTLDIATTAPGLQVYNGAYLPRSSQKTAHSPAVAPFSGIALEPQHWPDAPHHGHFPPITLLPDCIYRQITTYQLSMY